MRVSDFDFDLPPERIALRPAVPPRIREAACRPPRSAGGPQRRGSAGPLAARRRAGLQRHQGHSGRPQRPAHRPRRHHAEDRGAAAHAARRQPLEGLCPARQEAAGGRPAASSAERSAGGRWRARATRARSRSPLTCPDRTSMRPCRPWGRCPCRPISRASAASTRRTVPTTRRSMPRRKAPWLRPPPGCTSRRA